jgi:hypothetical protein
MKFVHLLLACFLKLDFEICVYVFIYSRHECIIRVSLSYVESYDTENLNSVKFLFSWDMDLR